MTLDKRLHALSTGNHCGESKNESNDRKAKRAMSKSLHADAANQGAGKSHPWTNTSVGGNF